MGYYKIWMELYIEKEEDFKRILSELDKIYKNSPLLITSVLKSTKVVAQKPKITEIIQ